MKYTYQISFNSSDYLDLTAPNIKFSGEWIEGTKIWRENISEIKITKRDDATVFNTLESYFTDSTKFATKIFVKVLKSGVQDSLHWFGVKWGTLNEDQSTYTVQPLVYDLWSQYFESVADQEKIINVSDYGQKTYIYLDTENSTDLHNYLGESINSSDYSVCTLFDRFRQLNTAYTDFPDSDIVSSFINDDDFEDSSSLDQEYGIDVDYVTEEQSYIMNAGGYFPIKQSIKDYLNELQLFNIYPFFDSNDKLRLEHVKFFNDKLEDNKVDFSDNIDSIDNEWSYDTTEIPTVENIEMNTEDSIDEDFVGYPVVYSENRNRPDQTSKDFTSPYLSDLAYYNTNSLDIRNVLYSASQQFVYQILPITVTGTTLTNDKNYLNMTSGVGGTSRYESNSFKAENSEAFFLRVATTAVTGTISFFLQDNVTETAKSNVVTVTTTGTTTGTLTTTAAMDSACLRIEIPASNAFNGYVIIEYGSKTKRITPTIEGFASGEIKTNGAFSAANIFNFWRRETGLSRSATYNGSVVTFNATQFNLRRKDVRLHYSGEINPLYGFYDGTRTAMIEKWERDPETDYYTISLIYQEDE